jgi:hypothetical protein
MIGRMTVGWTKGRFYYRTPDEIEQSDNDIFYGYVAHYAIGIGFAIPYVIVWDLIIGGSASPTWAIVYGVATTAGPYFLLRKTWQEAQNTFFNFTMMGRFITSSGTIGETFTICPSTDYPFNPRIAFDGENYLAIWGQGTDGSMVGRFFNTTGVPIDTSFVIFSPEGDRVPWGGISFGGGRYLAVATRIDSTFSNGDVYGRYIQPVTTGIEQGSNHFPGKCRLSQNYPNPFNPVTTIEYFIPRNQYVKIILINALGQQVKTIYSGAQTAGSHRVEINGENLPSGIYYYLFKTNEYQNTKKCLLLK